VKVVDISSPANHAALAAHTGPDSLHVFSGFFSHPLVWAGFRRLAPSQAQLAIYSEAPEQPPLTGWLKRARGRFLAARWSQRVAFVLAVGGVGCAFFTAIGFPREKIVPFGYYLSAPAAAPPTGTEDGPFRFFSAGQLIRRKGIDLLIQACASLPRDGWRLDIYGDGPERPCAVLPSRFDGWGMLVNESLAAGTPVICTSQCGAAVFPAECGVAAVAPAATSSALARAISVALAAGPPPAAIRSRLTAAVRDRGSAPAAAARFLAACPA
jgi:glycosyltransferase involved in cell wall biosynthesis